MAIGTQNLPSKLSPSRELTLIFSKGNGDDSSFMGAQYTYYVKYKIFVTEIYLSPSSLT